MTAPAGPRTVAGGVTVAVTSVALTAVGGLGAWIAPWVALFWLVPSLGVVAGLLEW